MFTFLGVWVFEGMGRFGGTTRISSTILTSQVPIKLWHDQIGDPTVADSILDRLVHNAHRIELEGPSMRKSKTAKLDSSSSKNSKSG